MYSARVDAMLTLSLFEKKKNSQSHDCHVVIISCASACTQQSIWTQHLTANVEIPLENFESFVKPKVAVVCKTHNV